MATFALRELAPGWTTASYINAMLSVLAESWGPYTTYGSNTTDGIYHEFPDLGGGKVVGVRTSPTAAPSLRIAGAARNEVTTQGKAYRTYQALGAIHIMSNSNFPTTEKVRLFAFSGEGLRAFAAKCGTFSIFAYAAELQNPAPYWGSSKRLFAGGNTATAIFLAGYNPWGTVNPETGNPGVTGFTNHSIHRGQLPTAVNTLLGKRQVSVNNNISNNEATVGMMPPDMGFVAASGLTSSAFYKLVSAEGEVFMSVGDASTGCIKVTGELPADLPVEQVYVIDQANPTGQEGVTDCPPPERPLSGQLHPLFVPVPPPPNPNPETP